ncbi:AAA family ATPase [Trujillonella humicola]|uniref:AAA family ATPase n=1 Tax=Trujillonella humicola TaxID=3383699 RepID=UPI003905E958
MERKWGTNTGWPKRLDWIEIRGVRGWTGQRFDMPFPIMAVVGENGVGKSTVLQASASVYSSSEPGDKERFASDFFPTTTWDQVSGVEIRYAVREGGEPIVASVRKPTDRWRGNPERRQRPVRYIDLSRIQPVPARVGYSRLANPTLTEVDAVDFDQERLGALSTILGRKYELARMATLDADQHRQVPVIAQNGSPYSGFHQGAGETTIAELLGRDLPRYSLVLIDEAESSLHPRAQRRLIRDLAEKCRERELQIILTTHSPYILEELPAAARACILQTGGAREIVYGVSPAFAMSKIDDQPWHEIDLYVEDARARQMLVEALTAVDRDLVPRCQVIPFGAVQVGKSLGQMVEQRRFPRPTCVFLDGDAGGAPGCEVLPGDDAPERVVFEALADADWPGLAQRLGRPYAEIADACSRAMTQPDHHDWVVAAASPLTVSGDNLWQAMCAEWATRLLPKLEAEGIARTVRDALEGIDGGGPSRPAVSSSLPQSAGPVPPGPGAMELPYR